MISHIVACSENGVIGVDGKLPWDLPEDLKRFKEITSNRVIIMGRKTHESIGRALPNRMNIVVTRQPDYFSSGCHRANSVTDALEICEYDNDNWLIVDGKSMNKDEIFIIGGGEIYKQSMDIVDKIYMTRVYGSICGDAFYPTIPDEFEEVEREDLIGYSYITYRRRDVKV